MWVAVFGRIIPQYCGTRTIRDRVELPASHVYVDVEVCCSFGNKFLNYYSCPLLRIIPIWIFIYSTTRSCFFIPLSCSWNFQFMLYDTLMNKPHVVVRCEAPKKLLNKVYPFLVPYQVYKLIGLLLVNFQSSFYSCHKDQVFIAQSFKF